VGNSRQVLVHERNETIEGAWHAISQLTERLGDRVLCDRSQFLPPVSRRPTRRQSYASLDARTIMAQDAQCELPQPRIVQRLAGTARSETRAVNSCTSNEKSESELPL
jgi:hypothetical protein